MTGALRYTIGDPGRAAERIGDGKPSPYPEWPDQHTTAVDAGGLTVRAASVRGLAHRAYGQPRQDACTVHAPADAPGGPVVAVVCDGVGSLEHSHAAAHLVVEELPALLVTALTDRSELAAADPPDWSAVFATVSARLDDLAAGGAADRAPRPMATTVLAAVLTRTDDGAHRAELGWVGDSTAYLLRDRTWQPLTADNGADGELITGATAALPAPAPGAHTAAVDLQPGDALFLLTDGVATPLGSGHGEVGVALAEWWVTPPEPEEFAAQVAFARRSFDDDRTAIGIWNPAPPGGDPAACPAGTVTPAMAPDPADGPEPGR